MLQANLICAFVYSAYSQNSFQNYYLARRKFYCMSFRGNIVPLNRLKKSCDVLPFYILCSS